MLLFLGVLAGFYLILETCFVALHIYHVVES
jgi:hypothetical protein